MAGGRALAGVAAGAGSGAGVPGLLGLLVVMEAGVPVPVPGSPPRRPAGCAGGGMATAVALDISCP